MALFAEFKRDLMQDLKWNKFIEYFIFFIGISFFIFNTASKNYPLFHTLCENFGTIITFCIFIISINTYSINRNSFFLVLGIGYGFAGVFYMLHNLTLLHIGLFKYNSLNLSSQFGLIARSYGSIFTLMATIVLYRGNKKINPRRYLYGALAAALLIIWGGEFQEMLPATFVSGIGYTSFTKTITFGINIILCVCMLLLYKMKENLDIKLYYYMNGALITRLISEILLTGFSDAYSMESVLSHIFKIFYYYLIYKALVQKSLKEPYKLLYTKLDETEVSLSKAASELKETNEKIEKDNAYINYMEDILINSEQCYRLIVENSRDAIFVQSNGKFVFYNESARNMLGLGDNDDIIGREVNDFVIETEQEKFNKIIASIYKEKIIAPFFQTGLITTHKKELSVEVSGTYFSHRGEPAILTIVRDISSYKQMEELRKDAEQNSKLLIESREYNKLITEFFANISHELRTPLNVILSAIQMLDLYFSKEENLRCKDKVDRYAKSIKQNCFRLLRLINNLIDLTKIGAGFLVSNKRNLNIINTVEDIVQSVAEYIKDKGVSLVFDTEVEEKIMAFDPDKMERIVLNLLSNAIKFTKPGDEIAVSIIDKGSSITLSVKDTGIGIPEEKLKSIFDRFVQVDKSLTRNHEGSGIGLSLVKSLVELEDGTIEARSALNEGTEFIINFPVKTMNDESDLYDEVSSHTNVERICIEFSDIYSYN